MCIYLMEKAWKTDLPPREKLVLLCLADAASAKNRNQCWHSVEAMAAKCSMEERTFQRATAALVKEGHITKTVRPHKSNAWKVHPIITIQDDTDKLLDGNIIRGVFRDTVGCHQ